MVIDFEMYFLPWTGCCGVAVWRCVYLCLVLFNVNGELLCIVFCSAQKGVHRDVMPCSLSNGVAWISLESCLEDFVHAPNTG